MPWKLRPSSVTGWDAGWSDMVGSLGWCGPGSGYGQQDAAASIERPLASSLGEHRRLACQRAGCRVCDSSDGPLFAARSAGWTSAQGRVLAFVSHRWSAAMLHLPDIDGSTTAIRLSAAAGLRHLAGGPRPQAGIGGQLL